MFHLTSLPILVPPHPSYQPAHPCPLQPYARHLRLLPLTPRVCSQGRRCVLRSHDSHSPVFLHSVVLFGSYPEHKLNIRKPIPPNLLTPLAVLRSHCPLAAFVTSLSMPPVIMPASHHAPCSRHANWQPSPAPSTFPTKPSGA